MSNDDFDKVMKGVNNPKKHNPYHKENEKKAAAKKKAVDKALKKRKGKHRGGPGDDVIDSGMFSS